MVFATCTAVGLLVARSQQEPLKHAQAWVRYRASPWSSLNEVVKMRVPPYRSGSHLLGIYANC